MPGTSDEHIVSSQLLAMDRPIGVGHALLLFSQTPAYYGATLFFESPHRRVMIPCWQFMNVIGQTLDVQRARVAATPFHDGHTRAPLVCGLVALAPARRETSDDNLLTLCLGSRWRGRS